ncbi:MAG: xylulokinase [Spirochaetales bacterium]|nr:xylulokinase [Spirochaetales bacterium]
MGYIVAYDLGTGGLKAALYSDQGKFLDSLFAEYPTLSARETWAEQSPDSWWSAFCSTTGGLIEKHRLDPHDIAVVSFSGQMMACLPVDRGGRPLRDCLIWADRRSTAQTEALRRRIDEQRYYRITGNRIYPTYSLPKYMWLKENEPDVYGKTFMFLQPKDYIVFRLTGTFATDYSDASGTAALDMTGRDWSAEVLELAGIDADKLPEIRSSTDRVGAVSRAAAGQCALASGTPVVLGAGDGPCGNLGAGVYEEGKAYLYLGTSSWISLASRQMVADPQMVLFNICSVDPGMTYVYGTMQMGGGSLQWLKETICVAEKQLSELTGTSPYAYMTQEAEKSPPGARKLVFLPYLRGERSPRWNPRARGAFIGLSASHTRGDIIRSVLEGITCNLKIIRDAIGSEGARVKQMRAIGGGAESRLWRQIFADVFQEPIHVPVLLEGANTLGSAILGGVGAGIFDSFRVIEELNPVALVQEPSADPQSRRAYQELFALFDSCYQALTPIFDRM